VRAKGRTRHMSMLRVVVLKPSKYAADGSVERFRRGFMPNSTVPYLASMTPPEMEIHSVDEYVQTDLRYLGLLHKSTTPTLLALVGVQSHQFQRSLDLAAYALDHGVEHCIVGGPHPMTCDTSRYHGRGLSFALAEAEMIWPSILADASRGELRPVYGADRRWQANLDAPVLVPPSPRDLRRYVLPMMGIYPARGCPFTCNFCSVIKIAGRQIRSQSIDVTLATLRAAKSAGVRWIMFTSDNFNKYPEAAELLKAMIAEDLRMPFFVQCDTQIARQEELIELLGRAGCFQIFLGVESFKRKTLLAARKSQNHPQLYGDIVRLCRKSKIATHFSNIIGFPEDTEASIYEHLGTLKSLDPDHASFYILTPIPGTEQYDEFVAKGAINEPNLDRFDGTCPTWSHPHLSADKLRTLLFECYKRFYSGARLWRSLKRNHYSAFEVLNHLFYRLEAFHQIHPMSGGVRRIRLDRARDYAHMRTSRFDITAAPLPLSLTAITLDSGTSHAH
jgi:hypothetical protein